MIRADRLDFRANQKERECGGRENWRCVDGRDRRLTGSVRLLFRRRGRLAQVAHLLAEFFVLNLEPLGVRVRGNQFFDACVVLFDRGRVRRAQLFQAFLVERPVDRGLRFDEPGRLDGFNLLPQRREALVDTDDRLRELVRRAPCRFDLGQQRLCILALGDLFLPPRLQRRLRRGAIG